MSPWNLTSFNSKTLSSPKAICFSNVLLSNIFPCLAAGEGGHLGFMAFYKVAHPSGVGLAVFAQRPANGFVDEKFLRAETVDDYFFKQRGIGLRFTVALMIDCHAAKPDVFIHAPCQQHRVGFGMAQGDFADQDIKAVNGVPP